MESISSVLELFKNVYDQFTHNIHLKLVSEACDSVNCCEPVFRYILQIVDEDS